MATADISKEAVFDQRIVQNPPRYAVDKGALSLTNAPYAAIGNSASQHTYNINVPSQNVFVDRAIDWSSTFYLQMTVSVAGTTAAAGQQVLRWGTDAALAAFPLHEMVSTMTATINDTSVVINTDTVLKEVLRLTDYKKNRSVRTCPTMLDKYMYYADGQNAINSPIGGFNEETDYAETPNGAWYAVQPCNAAGAPIAAPVVVEGTTQYTLYFKCFSTEKLVLSPFIFADSAEYDTGLFGINNIQLVMNFKSNIGRVVRNDAASDRAISAVSLLNVAGTPFADSKVNVQFLTPSLDIPLPPKSVVPYLEFPRYISQQFNQIAAGAADQLQSQTIVLPQIPDMLIIYCRDQNLATAGSTVADYYLPIDKISLNFDNFAGLLSSHTREQLYHMACHNGLEMPYNQWYGKAYSGAGSGSMVPLTGGFLILKPGIDFALQSGQAPSLIGNFTLQFQVNVRNESAAAVNPQLVVIAVNSGFFETLAGSSRIIKGVLSEADIISAEPAPEGSRENLQRLVGHGFFSSLGSILSKAKDIYHATKPAVSAVKGMLPEGKIKDILGKVGYGHAGAGHAGAGMAGAGKKSLSARLM